MIELKLIPDGQPQVPYEARDHGWLWDIIQSNSTTEQRNAFVDQTPCDSIRDIQRVVPGSGDFIDIRLPGDVTDYPSSLLDAVEQFFTNNIAGLKAHPNGWQYVEP